MEIQTILIWHQGALGDLLLAGPALAALSRHYPQARITALGHPERWRLLASTLPVAEVWDSSAARWTSLFMEEDLPQELRQSLATFQLALVFAPRPQPTLLRQLHLAGIPAVHWLPSFPETGVEAVAVLQARALAGLGVEYVPAPFKLQGGLSQDEKLPELPGPGPWLAVGPGSGHPHKNWPLAHYYEASRTLAWKYGLKVVWLAGPAEEAMRPYLAGLAAAQGQVLLANLPLDRVARVLSRSRLYLGNDSGLTHLAAAAGTVAVLALFGPSDPRVWAPWGPQVRVLTAPCAQAPCAAGRAFDCLDPLCMAGLSVDKVLAAAGPLLAAEK